VTKRSPERLARMRELHAKGIDAAAIGRDLRVNGTTVRRWAKAEGLAFMPGAERASERMRLLFAGKAMVMAAAAVPAWVPDDLRGLYQFAASSLGEEAAACAARAIKRERAAVPA
jgi:hypothetical protein